METRGEVEGAAFGDGRLSRRLVRLAEMPAKDPSQSLPKATGTDAELEGTYRFLNNRSVAPEAILAPHFGATVQRCAALRHVLIAHDTTELGFGTSRPGLGRGRGAENDCFLGHFALAVTPAREALGVIGLRTPFRGAEKGSPGVKESRRWHELVDDVASRVGERFEAVHVMDREADAYELLAALIAKEQRFVIRQQFDREVMFEGEAIKTRAAMEGAPVLLEREVKLAKRAPGKKTRTPPKRTKKHPPRPMRVAQLRVTARQLDVHRPAHLVRTLPSHLTLNVVLVHEPNPPAGMEPVDWCLITTAALGGHIKNNGDPGWIVLGRGYEDLPLLEQGAALALGWRPDP